MTAPVTLDRALTDRNLLAAAFDNLASWLTWRATLKAAYAEPLNRSEREAFAKVSGDRAPPQRRVKELVAVASRRAGKGRIAGAVAVYEAALCDHRQYLAPGEVGVVAVVSPTRAQSCIVRDYACGFLEASDVLRGEIFETTADEIRLRNGNVICTLASDFRSLRGRTLLAAVLDEAAFLRDELSASPDIEAARALLPGLATTNLDQTSRNFWRTI